MAFGSIITGIILLIVGIVLYYMAPRIQEKIISTIANVLGIILIIVGIIVIVVGLLTGVVGVI